MSGQYFDICYFIGFIFSLELQRSLWEYQLIEVSTLQNSKQMSVPEPDSFKTKVLT